MQHLKFINVLTLIIVIIGLLGFLRVIPSYASPDEVVCDNQDSCFTKHESAGEWGYIQPGTGDSSTAYNKHAYWTFNNQNQPLDWGQWKPNLPQAGTYDIYIWYPHFPGYYPETNNAHYQIHHADGDHKFTQDQAGKYGMWNKVATVRCRAGTDCFVKLTDETAERAGTRRVWFDAVKFVRIGPFEAQPDPVHSYTQLRGATENGKTTIFLQVCGRGEHHRFRSVQLSNNRVLWDQVYDALDNNCSREYRAVVDAVPGDRFRFYSTVMNDPISDADFLNRRRDSCVVLLPGQIACTQGDSPPPIANPVDPEPLPPVSGTCGVPFFSQRDPAWKNHPLRTQGQCSAYCGTIGNCGCTLTSNAMILRYYGAATNPPRLSDCMGSLACPLHWNVAANCSGGKARLVYQGGFSWGRLEQEVNQNHRPVILGMTRGNAEHWVVVISGRGSNSANYTINDPWPINGANLRLSNYAGWNFGTIVVYNGQKPCRNATMSNEVSTPRQLTKPDIQFIPTGPAGGSEVETIRPASLPLTGTVTLYRTTGVTMTLALMSSGGDSSEMLIWTDTISSTTWQAFAPYVALPSSEVFYAQFRDSMGNLSAIMSDTLYPVSSPPDVTPVLEHPLEAVQAVFLAGPTTASVATSVSFTVTAEPVLATVPITYTWQATDQTPVIQTGALTETMNFTWNITGTKIVTVTATNGAGEIMSTHELVLAPIAIPTRQVYLPLVRR